MTLESIGKPNNPHDWRNIAIYFLVFIIAAIIIGIVVKHPRNSEFDYKSATCDNFENPFSSDEEGHYAGYEWALTHDLNGDDTCSGSSDSFIQGCQEYITQKQASEKCWSKDYKDGQYY